MVKITNGITVKEVTRGAYNSIYKHQGYQVVNEEKDKKFVADPSETNSKTADEIFIEELLEKPISQWNKDEVKRFAAIKSIDITETKNVNEAKAIIKHFLNGDEDQDQE